MPVYNAAKFLQKAIDSILNQTFTDFELIIINDCSTDGSEEIIKGYNDSRIKAQNLPVNGGIVHALNTGLKAAVAPLTAIMHADDIAIQNRLQRQFMYMQLHPKAAVVAGLIINIDEEGRETGVWKEDRENISAKHIKARMITDDCIAHPSVMMRTDIARKYYYQQNQQYTEDYGLWLKILADGYAIEKLAEPVLYYRVHQASITGSILRKSNPFFKIFNCKRHFLWYRLKLGKWGWLETQVLVTTIYHGLFGIGKNIKQRILS